MNKFDEIYDRTLLEKYGIDGEYIAMHQMDSDFQRLFMINIVKECAEICHKLAEDSDSYVVHDGDTCASQIKKHFGVEK